MTIATMDEIIEFNSQSRERAKLMESIKEMSAEDLRKALAFHVYHIKMLHEEVDRRLRGEQ